MATDWTAPDADTFGRALLIAEGIAHNAREKMVVVATIQAHELGFNVHTADGYAVLRESGKCPHLAPVCAVLPDGTIEVYPVVEDWLGAHPMYQPREEHRYVRKVQQRQGPPV